MNKTTNVTQDYRIGAAVICPDGNCGKLTRVVIDPATNEITDLIVEKGTLLKHDRVIPVSAIEKVSPQEILLNVESSELEACPKYTEREFLVPVGDWEHERYETYHTGIWAMPYGQTFYDLAVPMQVQRVTEGIASTLDAIGRGTPVIGLEEQLGTVNHILANRETGEITHLIVRKTGLIPDYRIMTIDQIATIDADGIHSTLTEETFMDLPEYKSRSKQHAAV